MHKGKEVQARRILQLYQGELKEDILKGFSIEEIRNFHLMQVDSLEKSISGKIKKKVKVSMKDGSFHYAVRWVNPDTGQSDDLQHNRYRKTGDMTADEDTSVQEIVSNDSLKSTEKFRKLASLGIYDKKTLATLSGHKYPGDIKEALKKEVQLNSDDYNDSVNSILPSSPPPGTVSKLQDEEVQKMSISEIQDKFGSKAAFEAQRNLKQEIIDKYGLTVEDKWDSYEQRLTTLVVNRFPKAVMAYGTGGIGKTYTFEKVAAENGLREFDEELGLENGGPDYDYYIMSGKGGSLAIQRAMYEHSNKLIVFDDFDSMWKDDDLINVFKKALDTSGDNKCQWAKPLKETEPGKGDTVPSRFRFTGRMLFITNLTKKELDAAGASPITESRCSSIDLTMTAEQAIQRLKNVLPYAKILTDDKEEIEATFEDKEMAFEIMNNTRQYARIEQINNRVLGTIIMQARTQRERTGEYDQRKLEIFLLQQYGLG